MFFFFFFIKNVLFQTFDISVCEKDYEGILGLSLTCKVNKRRIVLFSCYLPHHDSTRGRDASLFFGHLLSGVYLHWDADLILICGDLNSRVGDRDGVVSDIDAVQTRIPVDVHAKPNQHGLEFLEFFNEAKLCTLNGRGDKHRDNFTCIITHGNSVVDFMCVLHDWLSYCSNFEVNTSRELISMYNLESCVGNPKHISDHSMLKTNVYFLLLVGRIQTITLVLHVIRMRTPSLQPGINETSLITFFSQTCVARACLY